MRVWQPGGHLVAQRGDVKDWSWRQTRRRLAALARLTAPYKWRTALALGSLLAATVTALMPPYLAKLAIDNGIRPHDLHLLTLFVIAFLAAGIANWATSSAQTYFTGWTGERILADLRNKLFRHLQRLSLGYYERNRAGVIISRLTNAVEPLDQLVTDGFYFPFVDLLSTGATVVVLGYGGYRFFGGSTSLGTLFAFMLYISNFFDPIQQLSQLYNTFLSATAALDKIMDVLDTEPEVLDRPAARDLPQVDGRVSFEAVRFGYGDGPEVLHGLDLDVAPGTTVALVGHT